jgi:hypothetical protein
MDIRLYCEIETVKRFSRWNFLHIGSTQFIAEPEQHIIALGFMPQHDAVLFAIPTFIVIRTLGTSVSKPDLYGIDPLSGTVLWRFSDAVGTYPLLNCHVEYDSRIIATTPDGVFLLERQAWIPQPWLVFQPMVRSDTHLMPMASWWPFLPLQELSGPANRAKANASKIHSP